MKNKYIEAINLKNKITIITGSSGYLGQMIANTYAELGSNLILIDKRRINFSLMKKKYKEKYNVNIYYKKCDLEKEKDRKKLITWIKNNFKKIDVLVNNAAMTGASKNSDYSEKFNKQSLATWNRALNINLTSVFDLVKNLSPLLKKSKNSKIINISSIYGFRSPKLMIYEKTKINNPAAYSVSKNSIIHLTRWLATNLSPEIRVNCISPGGIYREQPRSFVKKYKALTPMKRMATENDFKGAIIFLSTQMSDYVTGQNLIIDGGWSI